MSTAGEQVLAVVDATGPGVWDTLFDGPSLLRRAVDALRGLPQVERVHILARPDVDAAEVDGLPVSLHLDLPSVLRAVCPAQRPSADDVTLIMLLHDAARGLAPPAVARAVLAAVRVDGAAVAVPVLPVTDTMKQLDGDGRVHDGPHRDGLRAVQTPQAMRMAVVDADPGPDALGISARYAAAGGRLHPVAGDPAAFAVRTAWDRKLAGLVLAGQVPPAVD